MLQAGQVKGRHHRATTPEQTSSDRGVSLVYTFSHQFLWCTLIRSWECHSVHLILIGFCFSSILTHSLQLPRTVQVPTCPTLVCIAWPNAFNFCYQTDVIACTHPFERQTFPKVRCTVSFEKSQHSRLRPRWIKCKDVI